MSLYVIRPISDRTAFTGRHTSSPFSAPWSATRQTLGVELRALNARHTVLEVDVAESDLRIDGELRASARPFTPAVRLAFESKHGPLTYATDRFRQWQDNMRAIALGLEALRKVDRYGITKRGEQYAGWKQLPGGVALGASHMTTDEAWTVLRKAAEVADDSPLNGQALFRKARGCAHPDRHGGDRTVWDQVEQAAKVLRLLDGTA